jgi:hypothetical protein
MRQTTSQPNVVAIYVANVESFPPLKSVPSLSFVIFVASLSILEKFDFVLIYFSQKVKGKREENVTERE